MMEAPGIDEDLVRFNDHEFRAQCTVLGRGDLSRIERDQIMSITGAVALQLYKFLDQMKGVDMTSNYNGKLF